METELTYVDDIFQPGADATIEELEAALQEAEEYLERARNVESIARSCQRGWNEYIEKLQRQVDENKDRQPLDVVVS